MNPRTAASALAVSLLAAGCGPVSSHSPQPPSSDATAWHAHPTRVSRTLHRPSSPARTRPQTRVPTAAPPAQQRGGAGAVNWDAIAKCESGGHWNHHTSLNGYWGGLQMDMSFWRSYHGDRYAARPDLATKAQQIAVAERAYRVRGLAPWPTCGKRG